MRGAGFIFARSGPDGQGEMTLERLHHDALEVTEHVRARLGVARVLLVANSFGSITGLRLVRNQPGVLLRLPRHRPEHRRRRPGDLRLSTTPTPPTTPTPLDSTPRLLPDGAARTSAASQVHESTRP
ncbi:hypothetical protein ACWCXX_20090 [Streptomyces sp. NPDC001732]